MLLKVVNVKHKNKHKVNIIFLKREFSLSSRSRSILVAPNHFAKWYRGGSQQNAINLKFILLKAHDCVVPLSNSYAKSQFGLDRPRNYNNYLVLLVLEGRWKRLILNSTFW